MELPIIHTSVGEELKVQLPSSDSSAGDMLNNLSGEDN